MKRFFLFLIPVVLVIIIVFGVIKVFILPDGGKGALQVTTQPLSKVYLNGAYIGNTPLCKCEATTMIRSGNYTLRVEPLEEGLTEFQETITITKGVLTVVDRKFGKAATSEGSIISLTPIANKTASELLVISFPENAEVVIDANVAGETPRHITDLTDSDHTLRLQKDGYKDKNVRIRTPAGYKLTATVYLGIQDSTATPSGSPTPQPTNAEASPSPTPTKTASKVTILQTPNGFLRVRQEPSLNGAEITRVSTGETFTLVEETSGWYKIELVDGTEGWISAQFASKK